MTHFERRKIEAEMIGRIYGEMCHEMGQERALELVTKVIVQAATEEGRKYAATASGGPSLEHFKEILTAWDDALGIEVVEDTGTTFKFNVVRCEYIRAYEDLSLPPELVKLLSCRRDAAFANGYCENMEFAREYTLAEGHSLCDFCYRWKGEAAK